MKPNTYWTDSFSMKYWSNGPSGLLWTDWRLRCSWSPLGEEDAVMVHIGTGYTDFKCLEFWSPGSRWPGDCLESPSPWFRSPPLLLFVWVAAEMNPVRWCRYLLLGPLVSRQMLRKENWDLFFQIQTMKYLSKECNDMQLSKYLAFHCWGRGGFAD